MQLAILGPLEVRDAAGNPIEVSGARLRALLVRLALEPGRPVSGAVLMDAVWGERLPADGVNALQTLVSRLRRALADAAVVGQSPAGYRLDVEPDDVDACCFERDAEAGARALRDGEPARARGVLDAALALWRGPALVDGGDGVRAAAARLEGLRTAALVDRAVATAQAGDPAAAAAELEPLAAELPLDERVAASLISALARSGRPAEALRAYEQVRARLADELGVDPSAELQDVHLAVLRGELDAAPPPAVRRTNLTAPLTSFVGREDAVARVGTALAEHRLVTLVGPGGAGKTRLAAEAGARLDARDGVWLAELAPLTDGADLAQAVLGALGLREKHLLDRRWDRQAGPPADAETRLIAVLADRAPVLVLDNCEHLIDDCAALAERLLGQCPQLHVLATSREPLGLIGEAVLAVPPLGQPATDASAEEALGYPAVRLFADRAGAARPDFIVDADNVATVVEIVRRLDGMPLAIELAAARLRTLPLAEIEARLSDRFRLLTGGSRTALPRQRTLRAVVRWSWDLLSAAERVTVERLAVFPSGIEVDSATAVVAYDTVPTADVADLLDSLVDKSLLHRVGDTGRLRMLETIREYGTEQLAERGELAAVRARHADHFGRLVQDAAPRLVTRDQLPWFERLSTERENIAAALRFRCDVGNADGAVQIAVGLGTYSMMLGERAEFGTWITEAMAVPGAQDEQLHTLGEAFQLMTTVVELGGRDVTVDMQTLAKELSRVDYARFPLAGILGPAIAFFAGDQHLAKDMLDTAVRIDDPWLRAAARMFRATLAENNGDIEAMREHVDDALKQFRAIGERWGLANTLGSRALLHTFDGELEQAQAVYAEALEAMRELNSREDQAQLLVRLADLAMRRGDAEQARGFIAEALARAEHSGAAIETVWATSLIAELERQTGNAAGARDLHRQAMSRVAGMPEGHPALRHSRTIVLILSARLSFDDGDRDAALQQARDAYDAALGTHDLPIIASVGVVIADFAARLGQDETAVRILGAAARLRGADDPTAIDIVRLTVELRDRLGARFDELYRAAKDLDRDAALRQLDPAEVLVTT